MYFLNVSTVLRCSISSRAFIGKPLRYTMAVLESLHQVQNRSTQWPLPAENYICGGGKNIDADRSRASGIWACLRMKDLQTAYLFCMEHPELQASGVLIFFSTYSGTLLQCLLSLSLLGTCQMQSITQHLSLSISCSAIGWWFKVFQYLRIEALACH